MRRDVIFLITTIFILCEIEFGDTNNLNATTEMPKNADENDTEELKYKSEPCTSGRCIYKCCPEGQSVRRKRCVDNPRSIHVNFTGIDVYDENIYKTGKKVPDVFTILHGTLLDEDFYENSVNTYPLEYIPYILENGDIQLEMPNSYYRWTLVKNGNFCIDYGFMPSGVTKSPMVWAIIIGEDFPDSSDYMTAGMLVSCFFLLLVFIVYLLLPELQNICGMILMAYVASQFMAFLLMATIQLGEHSDDGCVGLTYGIYGFFLASFCWMSVMSYDIWWTFRGYAKARPIHRRGEGFKFLMYCLCAWGGPLLMTIGVAIVNTVDMKHWPWFITPQVPKVGCFLEGGMKFVYLYIPMLILIICNWMFYLMTAFNVWRLSRGTAVLDSAAAGTPAAHRTQRNRFMVYLKLSVVMGLNWLLEIVSFVYPGFKMWYLSDVYNILIGFVIFLIFVCKKKIFRKLYKRYALKNTRRFYPGSSKSYSSGTNSDSSNPETTTLQICPNPKGFNGHSGSMRSL